MENVNRRRLFKLAAVGSAVAATAALPLVGNVARPSEPDLLGVHATLGLPQSPLPSYATYVLEGTLDLVRGAGLLTSRVVAGHPDDPSEIGLPGLTRIIKVTQVGVNGPMLTVNGVIEDRSQLMPGESAQVQLSIDRRRGTVLAPFGDRVVTLNLASGAIGQTAG
jgi:hypothetical protein